MTETSNIIGVVNACRSDSFSVSTPIPSSKLVQDQLSFTFIGDTPDDTKMGIYPLVIAEGSSEQT
jgi:hypothetical protein